MPLKPWREIAVPHEDVLKGTFQQAEFAADITRVHEGTASTEYQNPAAVGHPQEGNYGCSNALESCRARAYRI